MIMIRIEKNKACRIFYVAPALLNHFAVAALTLEGIIPAFCQADQSLKLFFSSLSNIRLHSSLSPEAIMRLVITCQRIRCQ